MTHHPITSDSIRSVTEWHQLARPEPDARARGKRYSKP